MIVTCQICGTEFEAPRRNGKNCSDECRKEYRRQRMRRLREENPEFYKQQYQEWYQNGGLAYHVEWQHAHPEYRKRQVKNQKRRYEANPGLKKVYDARHYQRHKEEIIAKNEARAKANADKYRPAKQASLIRYRARLAQAEGTWTAKEFKELCESTGNRCWYCQKQTDKLTADHMVPLSRGGSNGITNIAPACMSCNASKGATTPLEFLSFFNIS